MQCAKTRIIHGWVESISTHLICGHEFCGSAPGVKTAVERSTAVSFRQRATLTVQIFSPSP